jgi:hypothetical protein
MWETAKLRKPVRLSRNPCWLASFLLLSLAARAQTPENRGTADLSFSSVTGQLSQSSLLQTTGISLSLTDFWPQLGLVEANIGEYSPGPGGVRSGLSYLRISNLKSKNERISLTGGDFSYDPYPLSLPFSNISTPAMQLNGLLVETHGINHRIRFFGGREILQEGLRIPLVYYTGQDIFGGDGRLTIRKAVSLGGRFIWLSQQGSNNLSSVLSQGDLGKPLPAVLSNTFDLTWKPLKPLEIVSELGYSQFRSGPDTTWHRALLGGIVWDTTPFKAHATYIDQPVSYLPIAGYYTGARTGTFADFDYHATNWLNTFGSWTSQDLSSVLSTENLGFHGTSTGFGIMLNLPARTSLSAQYLLSTYDSGDQQEASSSWQTSRLITAVVSHAFKERNTTHLNFLRLETTGTTGPSGQTSLEAQDDLQFHHFTLSGGARLQQNTSINTRSGVYFSGGITGSIKSLTFYEHFEAGTDLASKTLFATSVTQSNTFGMQYRFGKGWNIGGDAWRSRLTTNLTGDPAATLSFAAPILPIYLANNQWTIYFRLTKQLNWGGVGGYSSYDIARYAENATPRVGFITGTISVLHPQGPPTLARSVSVLLDGYRTAVCDQFGKYIFGDVREGPHYIEIDEHRLPVDFSPAEGGRQMPVVEGQRSTIVNFNLHATGMVEGYVKSADPDLPGKLYLKLEPGGQYTLVDSDGHFSLDGIPEGDYTATLLVPKDSGDVLVSPASLPVTVVAGKRPFLNFSADKQLVPTRIRPVEINPPHN